jgi:hypothetical protein
MCYAHMIRDVMFHGRFYIRPLSMVSFFHVGVVKYGYVTAVYPKNGCKKNKRGPDCF